MLSLEALKELVHQRGMPKTTSLMLCLAFEDVRPKKVQQIREIAAKAGIARIRQTPVPAFMDALRRSGMAFRTNEGWELSKEGKKQVAAIAGTAASSPAVHVAGALRAHIAEISDTQTLEFLDEAIKCLEYKLFRSAIVLSWVGAVAVLHEHVVSKKLDEFNSEMMKRNSKAKAAKTKDDLAAAMKESDFLVILAAISVIGKNVKKQLEQCLDLRNACGHPSSLKVGENKAAAHIETLIQNVFAKF